MKNALLCRTLAGLERPPRVLLSGSAMGFYGDRGDTPLTEESPPGEGFLPELSQSWEAATAPAEAAGIRVVHLRTGMVLDPRGGALKAMLPIFQLGLGGPLAGGRHWQAWIALDDWVGLAYRALLDDRIVGPLNLTAPHPVRQREFARTLGRVLCRPAIVPAPGLAVRAVFGSMGQGAVLVSHRVLPRRALDQGFEFRFPHLEPALRTLLARMETP